MTTSYGDAIAIITQSLVEIGEDTSNYWKSISETVEEIVVFATAIAERLAECHGLSRKATNQLTAKIAEDVRCRAFTEIGEGSSPDEVLSAVKDNPNTVEAWVELAVKDAVQKGAEKHVPLINRIFPNT